MRSLLFPLLLATAVLAPARSGAQSPTPAAPATVLPDERALGARLSEAEAEIASTAAPPPGIDAGEVEARKTAVTGVVAQSLRAIEELQRRKTLLEERTSAESALSAWEGFEKPPPYSIFLADWYRDARATARMLRATQTSGERLAAADLERARNNAVEAGRETRALQEGLGGGPANDESARTRSSSRSTTGLTFRWFRTRARWPATSGS